MKKFRILGLQHNCIPIKVLCMNINWDAELYRKNFSFVSECGEAVLTLLNVKKGDRVIDLGCGNGALAQKLADMGADVLGIDASAEMIAIAKSEHPNLAFEKADALGFSADPPADAVFSNAVFHWIDAKDHPLLLSRINRALKPGGILACEFCGKGNNAAIHSALKKVFAGRGLDYECPFYFPSIGEYATLLERAGFKVEFASLFDRPTEQVGEGGLANWIRMFDKIPFEGVSAREEREIIEEAARELEGSLKMGGKWFADYVRIRIKASKEFEV